MRTRTLAAPFAGVALTVAWLLGASVAPVSGASPASTSPSSRAAASASPASAPLPACHYQDINTRFQSTSDWAHTLVDTNLRVTRSYVPPDLVSVSDAHINGSGQIRSIVIDDLRDMARAARDANAPIAVRSSYRSYQQQVATFNYWVSQVGYDKAKHTSARPGHSEHQLGTTIDFQSGGSTKAPWDYPDWAKTMSGAWMAANAWKYGWLMSYPKGKSSVSCYSYEPWHYRYYGRALAAKIHDSGKVPRGYLWTHFESRP
jgi:D-alanyl-D-alanine carboxypeptidase